MKHKTLIIIICLLLIGTSTTLSIVSTQKEEQTEFKQNNLIAMYIEDDEGNFQLSNDITFPKDGYELDPEQTTCINGGTITQDASTKKISVNISKTDRCNLYFRKETFNAVEASIAITNNRVPKGIKSGTPNFAEAATTDEGVYAMADDYGTSYYYRGNVANNYVKFAGFWWRIIRINGDGSLRIIYDGTKAYTNETSDTGRLALTDTAWHPQYNDAKYVGYMFGPAGTTASTSKEQAQTNTADINMKTQLEGWYKTNIADKGLDQYVSDEIFCNDRSTPGKDATGWSSDTGLGYGTNATAYGAIEREGFSGTSHYDNPQPQFTCPNKNDAFTKSDTEKGNGALSQKVGLITADEIVAAGSGKYGTANSSYYLYKGNWYWSLSPSLVNTNGFAFVFYVHANGSLNNYFVLNAGGVAPVINLSAEYVKTLRGTGTMDDPYVSSKIIVTLHANGNQSCGAFNYTDQPTDTTTVELTIGKPYGDLVVPNTTCSSYDFDGWYTEANGGTKITSSTIVTEASNCDLYGHWA